MGKSVCRMPLIEVGGSTPGGGHEFVNVTRWFLQWEMVITLGELHRCRLTLVNDPTLIEIVPDERKHGVATSDIVKVAGVDISNWVEGYTVTSRVGMRDMITLMLHADPNVLRVNGATPWVDAGDEVSVYEALGNVHEAQKYSRAKYL